MRYGGVVDFRLIEKKKARRTAERDMDSGVSPRQLKPRSRSLIASKTEVFQKRLMRDFPKSQGFFLMKPRLLVRLGFLERLRALNAKVSDGVSHL